MANNLEYNIFVVYFYRLVAVLSQQNRNDEVNKHWIRTKEHTKNQLISWRTNIRSKQVYEVYEVYGCQCTEYWCSVPVPVHYGLNVYRISVENKTKTKPHKDLFVKPYMNNIIWRFIHILRHKIIIEKDRNRNLNASIVLGLVLHDFCMTEINLFWMSRWQLLRSIFVSN